MARRGIAAGAALLVLILLVLGVKGCLNARKERQLRDYARDVSALIDESSQVSTSFFDRLKDPGTLSTVEYEGEVTSDRSGIDSLLTRAQNLSVPGDMSGAQSDVVLAFELRADAMDVISEQIPIAFGKENRADAVTKIADAMRSLLASDVVLDQVARPRIEEVLSSDGVTDVKISDAGFLPDGIKWLDADTIDGALGNVTGSTASVSDNLIHGLGLSEVSANGSVLQEGVPVTVSAGGKPQLEIQVQNQGEATETGVVVTITVDGGQPTEEQIPSIEPSAIETVDIPLTPAPKGSVSITVRAEPVPGEEVADNNEGTYDVTFQ